MRRIYDVVIIGGGRSGLAVAQQIRKFTDNFLVIEARASIGCDPNPVVGTFQETVKKYGLERITINNYEEVNYYSEGGKIARTKVRTCIFRPDCLLHLMKKGIENKILTDCRVSHFVYLPQKEGVCLIADSGNEYVARIVVDASGANSFSTRATRKEPPRHWCDCYILQMENCNLDLHECSYFAGQQIANCGAWLYPIAEHTAQLGLADFNRSHKVETRNHHERLLSLLKTNPLLQKMAKNARIIPDSFRRFRYPNGLTGDFTDDNLIILGDAAGQATPLWGEGTRVALETGRIVGRIIEFALQERDYSHEMLRQYQWAWNDYYHQGYFWSALIRDFVPLMKDWQWDILTQNIAKLTEEEQARMLKTEFKLDLLYKLVSPRFFLGHELSHLNATLKKMAKSFIINFRIKPKQKSYVWNK